MQTYYVVTAATTNGYPGDPAAPINRRCTQVRVSPFLVVAIPMVGPWNTSVVICNGRPAHHARRTRSKANGSSALNIDAHQWTRLASDTCTHPQLNSGSTGSNTSLVNDHSKTVPEPHQHSVERKTMEHEAMTTRRGEIEILADLERLAQEPGFVYTFCLMTWFALWISPDEVTEIDWHQRPNNEELSLLLGLLVKRSLVLGEMPSEETLQRQADEATELLDELHRWCAFPAPGSHGPSPDDGHEQVPNLLETHREWMLSGQGMVEPIFYGGPGAYIFQYLKMAARRYFADAAWFQDELGLSFSSILQIAEGVHELSRDRLQKVDLWSSHEQICEDVLAAMSFHSEDIPGIERHAWDKFASVFSLVPGTVNRNLVSIGACNKVHSHPAVALSDGRHWVPLLPNLAESIYESPFYRMMHDEQYKDTASKNRGDVTEVITRDLLVPVFGSGRVHRGVVVTKGKNRRTDLDVLAVSGNKALIVQCKSQQLTLTARSGDEGMLRRDFHRAVQHAYDQALRGKRALLQRDCKFTDTTGNPVQLPKEIDEVYILCVTGDHYPAVITQTRFFLKKEDGEPDPVIMSVFDLDVVSFYLSWSLRKI